VTQERPGNPNIGAYAAIGNRAARRKRLNLTRVEAELGALTTIEDAQRRLRIICDWSAAGMLPGAVASACVRACEVFIKAEEVRVAREYGEENRRAIAALRAARKRGPIEEGRSS